jgi:DNA repair protein RecN (Recombination protein N)
MIERFYAKNLIGFDTVDVAFEPGLIAITGPSGAGKSVFMGALLALFGLSDAQAELSEVLLRRSELLDLESYADDEEDEITVRAVKKEKVRYFLNDLTISKKRLRAMMSPLVRHISQRSNNELSSELLLELLDAMAFVEEAAHAERLEIFRNLYDEYRRKSEKLNALKEDEKRVKELIEFAEFEIGKIDELAPRPGEDEELMAIKRKLSKKEKIDEAVARASRIFEMEDDVVEALSIIESDHRLFTEAMNMLRNEFERAREMLDELEDVDVGSVLDRIEALAELKRRYGSLEEALAYRENKIQELEYYRNIDHELDTLAVEVEKLLLALYKEAENITASRQKAAGRVEHFLNSYLAQLRMPPVRFRLSKKPLDRSGVDAVDIDMEGSSIETLSGGEFNRIRLALLLCKSELAGGEGVLLIDEIDANVSGDESIAIAKLLKNLSKNYQIVAISHQPHLSAAARQHLLVTKDGGKSTAKVLDARERVEEISRMIAGEKGMHEARQLAENLLKEFSR